MGPGRYSAPAPNLPEESATERRAMLSAVDVNSSPRDPAPIVSSGASSMVCGRSVMGTLLNHWLTMAHGSCGYQHPTASAVY